jgi:hypothetical protein
VVVAAPEEALVEVEVAEAMVVAPVEDLEEVDLEVVVEVDVASNKMSVDPFPREIAYIIPLIIIGITIYFILLGF